MASAELFMDLYLGGAFSHDADFTLTGDGLRITGDGDTDDSFTVGGRFGYWIETIPWLGIAFDASFFQPDLEDTDVTIIPLSLLLMARLQVLKSDNFPRGQFQYYVGVGPGMFISDIDADFVLVGPPPFRPLTSSFSDSSVDIGLDARAGLAWYLTKHWSVFAEYRFTYVEPDFKDDLFGFDLETDLDFKTHHALVGVSYHF
jgi:opacity protein-like surface antigen